MRAVSSMATKRVLADLLAAARDAGLDATELESVGGVDAAARVAAGEPFDLVFLADDALRGLATDGHVRVATVVPLILSQVAVGVPADPATLSAATPDVAYPDAAGLRTALRAASRIGYSTGPSGTALVRMIEQWGLADELGGRLVQARPGIPVARLLADGEVDLGLQQLSELVGVAGVRVLGVLPADCAIDTVFSGAVAAASESADHAAEVLAFLQTDAAQRVIREHHFALPA